MDDLEKLLEDLTEEAVSKFGEKQETYSFRDFQFNTEGPCIKYYGNDYDILLSTIAKDSRPHLIFQLSHEVVHTLGLNGPGNTNYLEEGVATYYSLNNPKCLDKKNFEKHVIEKTNYGKPYKAIKQLLSKNPNFIKQLRVLQPILARVSNENLMKVNGELSSTQVNFLLKTYAIVAR